MNILTSILINFEMIQAALYGPRSREVECPQESITSDDLGIQLSCYGDEVIETPHLDALAASGVLFDVAYVAQASCSPSRSAMLTGLYTHANGQYGLTATRTGLHYCRRFARCHASQHSQVIRGKNGDYAKLHVAPENSFQFDSRLGNYHVAWDVNQVDGRTAEFLNESSDKPFFLMVNFTDPHAYRSLDPETKERGPWTFRDRVEGIPEILVEPSEKRSSPATSPD